MSRARFSSRPGSSRQLSNGILSNDIIQRYDGDIFPADDPRIEDCVNAGLLRVASTSLIAPYKARFESESHLCFMHIVADSIVVPRKSWEFTFRAYMPWVRSCKRKRKKGKRMKHSRDKPDLQTLYVYHTFSASYEQLKRIDDTINDRMYEGDKYFALPRQSYPSVNKTPETKTKRGPELCNAMKNEQAYITKRKLLTKKKTFGLYGTRSATVEDLDKLSQYLHHLFSSPSLCKQDFVFDEFGFELELKNVIRWLAANRLAAWRASAAQPCIRDPMKLKNKIGTEFDFHTAYIVRRPLNDQKLKLLNFNHWAIKFEGKEQLMTTEFFAYSEKHGIIKSQIIPNTPQYRRVFWYWWQRDPHDPNQKPQYFTERWECMETIYVKSIQAGCIGELICTWLRIHSNAKYSVTTNNCQHYARDLTALLDIDVARRLNGLMDHRFVAAAIPAAALADGMSEEARTNEIYDVLHKSVREYNKKQQKKKPKDDDQDMATNWAIIAAQLGLDDDDDDDDGGDGDGDGDGMDDNDNDIDDDDNKYAHEDDEDESKATYYESSHSEDKYYNQCANQVNLNDSNSLAPTNTPSHSFPNDEQVPNPQKHNGKETNVM